LHANGLSSGLYQRETAIAAGLLAHAEDLVRGVLAVPHTTGHSVRDHPACTQQGNRQYSERPDIGGKAELTIANTANDIQDNA
jgi:hypothetical protein